MGYPTDKNGEACSPFHSGQNEVDQSVPHALPPSSRVADLRAMVSDAKTEIAQFVNVRIGRLRAAGLKVTCVGIETLPRATIGDDVTEVVVNKVILRAEL